MTSRSRRAWLGLALRASTAVVAFRSGAARAQAAPFDQSHAAWMALLRRHVLLVRGGQATQVAYASLAADRAALKASGNDLSGVTPSTFGGWTQSERQAFVASRLDAQLDDKALRFMSDRIRAGRVDIAFTDYDWALNNVRDAP